MYVDRAIQSVRRQEQSVPEELLTHLAPVGWQHINLTGDYLWDGDANIGPDGFRPVRTTITQPLPRAAWLVPVRAENRAFVPVLWRDP